MYYKSQLNCLSIFSLVCVLKNLPILDQIKLRQESHQVHFFFFISDSYIILLYHYHYCFFLTTFFYFFLIISSLNFLGAIYLILLIPFIYFIDERNKEVDLEKKRLTEVIESQGLLSMTDDTTINNFGTI